MLLVLFMLPTVVFALFARREFVRVEAEAARIAAVPSTSQPTRASGRMTKEMGQTTRDPRQSLGPEAAYRFQALDAFWQPIALRQSS